MPLHKPLLAVISLLCISMLSACAGTAQPPPAASMNVAAQSTIAVPANDDMLARALRDRLSAHGWSLIQYDAQALQNSRGYQGLARQAQYRLTLSNKPIGACRSGEASFIYNIALIENQSGDVRVGLTGADCSARIIERFDTALDRRQLSRSASAAPN